MDEFNQEANNVVLSQTVLSIAPPDFADLRASNLVSASTGVGGLRTTISWRVDNTGPNPTGDGSPGCTVDRWLDRIIASPNDILGDGDDQDIAGVEHLGLLSPGEGYDGFWAGTIPVALSGSYYIFVKANPDRVVYEYTDQESNVTRSPNVFEVLNSPVIDDDFDDGNLATNTTGIGTGWSSATFGGGLLLDIVSLIKCLKSVVISVAQRLSR